jgi:hypothetical protein
MGEPSQNKSLLFLMAIIILQLRVGSCSCAIVQGEYTVTISDG